MRRSLKFLVAMLMSIISIQSVFADEIICEYQDLDLTMTWDTEKKFDPGSNPFVEMGGYNSNQEYERFLLWRSGKQVNLSKAAEIDQKLYKSVLNTYGCNDRMRVCVYTEVASDTLLSLPTDLLDALFAWNWDKVDLGGTKQELAILDEESYKGTKYEKYQGDNGGFYMFGHDQVEERWDDGYNFGDVVLSVGDYLAGLLGAGGEHHTFVYKQSECSIAVYDGPYVGVNINCGILQNKMLKFMKTMNKYKKTSANSYERADLTLEVKKIEDDIKSLCRSIFENYDYDANGDNPGAQAECIDACMSIKETLNEHKKGTDLEDKDNSGQCGFSARLLVWVSNALRWIKYILPVVVIILSILDFIKAIGADKEDQMKKAQKKFVTRLIAAALVFIIPLIIEFVLDKMGFGYNDCGLF